VRSSRKRPACTCGCEIAVCRRQQADVHTGGTGVADPRTSPSWSTRSKAVAPAAAARRSRRAAKVPPSASLEQGRAWRCWRRVKAPWRARTARSRSAARDNAPQFTATKVRYGPRRQIVPTLGRPDLLRPRSHFRMSAPAPHSTFCHPRRARIARPARARRNLRSAARGCYLSWRRRRSRAAASALRRRDPRAVRQAADVVRAPRMRSLEGPVRLTVVRSSTVQMGCRRQGVAATPPERCHDLSPRAERHLRGGELRSDPRAAIESELFGQQGRLHRRQQRQRGPVRGGGRRTCCSTRSGELPPAGATRLAPRAPGGEVRRVGDARSTRCGRPPAGGDKPDLATQVQAGRFPAKTLLPPQRGAAPASTLRDRQDEIAALSRAPARRATRSGLGPRRGGSRRERWKSLKGYRWPSTSASWRTLVERALVLCEDEEIGPRVTAGRRAAGAVRPEPPRRGSSRRSLGQARAAACSKRT